MLRLGGSGGFGVEILFHEANEYQMMENKFELINEPSGMKSMNISFGAQTSVLEAVDFRAASAASASALPLPLP